MVMLHHVPADGEVAASVGESDDAGGAKLICRVDDLLVAIPLGRVCEIMRPLPVQPLARMPDFVSGVAIIRGAPVPVVRIGALLIGGEKSSPARFVTIRIGERQAALAVHDVLGVRVLPTDGMQALPSLLDHSVAEVVSQIGVLDLELLTLLRISQVVPESVWQAIAGRKVPDDARA